MPPPPAFNRHLDVILKQKELFIKDRYLRDLFDEFYVVDTKRVTEIATFKTNPPYLALNGYDYHELMKQSKRAVNNVKITLKDIADKESSKTGVTIKFAAHCYLIKLLVVIFQCAKFAAIVSKVEGIPMQPSSIHSTQSLPLQSHTQTMQSSQSLHSFQPQTQSLQSQSLPLQSRTQSFKSQNSLQLQSQPSQSFPTQSLPSFQPQTQSSQSQSLALQSHTQSLQSPLQTQPSIPSSISFNTRSVDDKSPDSYPTTPGSEQSQFSSRRSTKQLPPPIQVPSNSLKAASFEELKQRYNDDNDIVQILNDLDSCNKFREAYYSLTDLFSSTLQNTLA